jgi:hypothetical protein
MMPRSIATRSLPQHPGGMSDLPDTFLSCYEIMNKDALRWNVREYKVRLAHRTRDVEHGEAKQVVWALRKKHSGACRGYGFVIEVDEATVAVPSGWNLPSGVQEGEFYVTFDSEFTTDPNDRRHRSVITGILREGLKAHFKRNRSDTLGDLWQDYDRFCQMPDYGSGREFHFCRKFGVAAKVLACNRWVLQPLISTVTLDGRTFADYFRAGEVDVLTAMIEAKQSNRLNRRYCPRIALILTARERRPRGPIGSLRLLR